MIKIKINTGNDAFQDGNYGYEVARILRRLADHIENGRNYTGMNDSNGNEVCTVEYTGKDKIQLWNHANTVEYTGKDR